MNLETLPDRLAAIAQTPGNVRLLSGLAADFAALIARHRPAELTTFLRAVAPAVDQLAAGREGDPAAAFGCGLLTGLSVVAGCFERRLQAEAADDQAGQIARRTPHGEILARLAGTAKTGKALSEELRVDKSRVSRVLAELVEAGLVRQIDAGDKADRREKYFRLTPAGLAARPAKPARPVREEDRPITPRRSTRAACTVGAADNTTAVDAAPVDAPRRAGGSNAAVPLKI